MGSELSDDEKPVHEVTLTKGFWLLETEVTQEMWEKVMGETIEVKAQQGSNRHELHGEGPKYPMYYVSWDDCQDFCKKLSEKLGVEIQLPTEAQWEYACRAGSTEEYAGAIDEMAWYGEDANSGSTHEVGGKKPNAWNLYDMHGNVFEWCSDSFDFNYYQHSPTIDPENKMESPFRSQRGGAWSLPVKFCPSSYRHGGEKDYRSNNLGFRVLFIPN